MSMRGGKGAIALAAVLLVLPGRAGAQGVDMPQQEALRPVTILVGAGIDLPMGHLVEEATARDGFAKSGATLTFRGYIPIGPSLDAMIDLALPRFKVDTERFQRVTNMNIQEAFYQGKVLSVGGRWSPYRAGWGKAFLVASGGMYQLIYDRFEQGVQTVTDGAFRLGAAVGGGIHYRFELVDVDLTARYHRYTDTGNFGLGDLSWLELGFSVVLPVGGEE